MVTSGTPAMSNSAMAKLSLTIRSPKRRACSTSTMDLASSVERHSRNLHPRAPAIWRVFTRTFSRGGNSPPAKFPNDFTRSGPLKDWMSYRVTWQIEQNNPYELYGAVPYRDAGNRPQAGYGCDRKDGFYS